MEKESSSVSQVPQDWDTRQLGQTDQEYISQLESGFRKNYPDATADQIKNMAETTQQINNPEYQLRNFAPRKVFEKTGATYPEIIDESPDETRERGRKTYASLTYDKPYEELSRNQKQHVDAIGSDVLPQSFDYTDETAMLASEPELIEQRHQTGLNRVKLTEAQAKKKEEKRFIDRF